MVGWGLRLLFYSVKWGRRFRLIYMVIIVIEGIDMLDICIMAYFKIILCRFSIFFTIICAFCFYFIQLNYI